MAFDLGLVGPDLELYLRLEGLDLGLFGLDVPCVGLDLRLFGHDFVLDS